MEDLNTDYDVAILLQELRDGCGIGVITPVIIIGDFPHRDMISVWPASREKRSESW